jgi:hypothetical protein
MGRVWVTLDRQNSALDCSQYRRFHSFEKFVRSPVQQLRGKSTVLVMCNAYNHTFDCPCGFGGDTGGGGWSGRRSMVAWRDPTELLSGGWSKDSNGTVASYVNPNAHCPMCGAAVYFYRSPFDGRVFFDDLGWPWPKHPCTDNSAAPRRATRQTVAGAPARAEPTWLSTGWHPLLSAKIYSGPQGRTLLTGDLDDEFLELHLTKHEIIDRNTPVFVRRIDQKPYLFDVTFLYSDTLETHQTSTIAFHTEVASLNDDEIRKAYRDEAIACRKMAELLLTRGDLVAARPYLESAIKGGVADALFDLATIALFAKK